MQAGVFQVLATAGDAALGGDDFDQLIASWILEQAGLAEAGLGSLDASVASSLMAESVRIKEA